VTESQFDILRAAQCSLDTPAVDRLPDHHLLVERAVDYVVNDNVYVGGQLGRPSGARFKTYERLKPYSERLRGTLLEGLPSTQALFRAVEQIYQYPLREGAREKLNRQLRSGVTNEQLAELVVNLWQDDMLCLVQQDDGEREPSIICSMSLVGG
jgi:hypothetical protein